VDQSIADAELSWHNHFPLVSLLSIAALGNQLLRHRSWGTVQIQTITPVNRDNFTSFLIWKGIFLLLFLT
jgi:hypothetical protein